MLRNLDSIGEYLSYPIIRFITGILLIPHGYGKLYKGFNGNLDGFINFLDKEYSNPVFTGFFLQELGVLVTLLMYSFRERERVLDLFEMLSGARITLSYMRPGGVIQDAPKDFWPALDSFLQDMTHD